MITWPAPAELIAAVSQAEAVYLQGIGIDPSFRADERQLMSDEQIARNIGGIRQVFDRYLDFGAGAIMANNAEWLDGLMYVPFLRVARSEVHLLSKFGARVILCGPPELAPEIVASTTPRSIDT